MKDEERRRLFIEPSDNFETELLSQNKTFLEEAGFT
jgi:hypothetical protein